MATYHPFFILVNLRMSHRDDRTHLWAGGLVVGGELAHSSVPCGALTSCESGISDRQAFHSLYWCPSADTATRVTLDKSLAAQNPNFYKREILSALSTLSQESCDRRVTRKGL